ncbi:MAG: tetratricopeptide repeat protein [Phenylobacterium sp.]
MRTLVALMAAAAVAPAHPLTWSGEPPLSAETAAAVQKAQAGDFADLIKRADAGHPDAQVRLGRAYMSGAKGLPRDPAKACAYQEKAAPQRADAMHLAGLCHLRGLGGPADSAKAKAAFESALAMGYPKSKCALGAMLIAEGPEAERGLSLCHEAAQAGDAEAQAEVGRAYRAGRGAKADAKEARRWLEMAAAQKYAPAQRTLGEMYARGEGGKKDKKKAFEQWVAADKAGDAMTPILMGDFLFGELTGGKTPGPGKFRIPAGAPLSQVDEAEAWYKAAAARDPRPEVRSRATTAVSVLQQLKVGLQAKGHAP